MSLNPGAANLDEEFRRFDYKVEAGAEFILPVSGAAFPLGRSSRQILILTPRPGLGPLLLDRRAVTSFADAVQLALERRQSDDSGLTQSPNK